MHRIMIQLQDETMESLSGAHRFDSCGRSEWLPYVRGGSMDYNEAKLRKQK